MKKELLMSFCLLGLAACNTSGRTETLADLFVKNNTEYAPSGHTFITSEQPAQPVIEKTVEVDYKPKEVAPQEIAPQEVEVKYVEVLPEEAHAVPVETMVEHHSELDYDAPYSLAKRSDRYREVSASITPEVYAIVATRTTNKMLAEAPAIFAQNKEAPLYVAKTVLVDRYLPNGASVAGQTAKEIIVGADMFNLTDNKADAEFVLESSVDNFNTPEVPVIVFNMELYDKEGNLKGRWSDNIRQVQNDDGSWW